jgi:hypothetical protein
LLPSLDHRLICQGVFSQEQQFNQLRLSRRRRRRVMKLRNIVMSTAIAGALGAVPAVTVAFRTDPYPRQLGIKITNYTFDITLSDTSDELVVQEAVEVLFTAAGVGSIELDLCKFSAQPRSPQMASGVADPCAAPATGTAAPAPNSTTIRGGNHSRIFVVSSRVLQQPVRST